VRANAGDWRTLLAVKHRPLRATGALQDIAPTLLALFGVPQPKEMTGRDLHIL